MSDPGKRTFAVFVEDKPGVLNRIASLFRRRNYNIDSLNVGRTHRPGVSRMTVVCEADDATATRIEANLYKMVNVLRVDDITRKLTVDRGLALVKVKCTEAQRAALLQLCSVMQARQIDMSVDSATVEITGSTGEIQSLVASLEPYGILEMVQTGSIAMTRGSEKQQLDHPSVPTSRIYAA